MQPSTTIIMAGGLGKRMNSTLPKVLHKIGEFPMIYFVVKRAIQIGSQNILIVVGKYKDVIQSALETFFTYSQLENIHYILQPEIKYENGEEKVGGTGHAILCCLPFFTKNQIDPLTNVFILSGDVPLLREETLIELSNTPNLNSLLITKSKNPTGCGRVFFDDNRKITKIIEEKDCTMGERENKYVNCGIYYVTVDTLLKCIPFIKNNNKSGEYYLTDMLEIAITKQMAFSFYELPQEQSYEVMNINNPQELEKANQIYDVISNM
jgi:bifunctional N-acetylglucosamine-1-phosphate-uridyltransferase/glucosamine-1-phosphate-acetyltransferase GlmU-like protein